MRTIWKFPFRIDDEVAIEMPRDARVLTVQVQDGKPCLWALVDPKAPKGPRLFRLFGTGHPVTEELLGAFVGTFQINSSLPYELGGVGSLVFHLFEAA